MLNNQNISVKVRKKVEKILKKRRKIEDKMKQAKEMGDTVKTEKLESKIKKLEEDIKKMIELKSGKLEKVEGEIEPKVDSETEPKVEGETEPVGGMVDEKEVASPQPNPFEEIVQPQDIPNGQPIQQPVMPGQQPMMPGQQPMMPGQQPMMPGQIPPQEMVQTPQVSPQQPATVKVNFLLVGGLSIKIPMPGAQLQPFLQEVANTIDSQASMQIGKQLVSGRNIIVVQW